MSTHWAEQSGVAVRRRYAAEQAPTHERDIYVLALASRLNNPTVPPPPVPLDDPTRHATARTGSHQRVLVRPVLYNPTVTFIGRNINVVRL